jgi:hypothetical protein
MISNELLNNISDMVVIAERKGNTFVVTDVSKDGNEECKCSRNTELLKNNCTTAEMIVVADREGNTIVVKDASVSNGNNEGGCNCNSNNEEDIDDCNTVTTLSTIVSAVKSLSLSTSSSTNQQLQPEQEQEQSPKQRRRITIATLMTGRRGRKLLYLFKIKSNSDRSLSEDEKNVSRDDLDRLLFEKLVC